MARVRDIRSKRPDVDRRRRARFHTGWKHAVDGRAYAERDGITWMSVGNRWGLIFGERPKRERDQTYDLLVQLRVAVDDE